MLENNQNKFNKNSIKVLVTGVFDLLHQQHLAFLKKAKQQGDYLIVGIESDERVKQLKGADRPVYNQKTRKQNLDKTQIADKVIILPENFSNPNIRKQFLEQVKPDILAVSSHSPFLESKQKAMSSIGGQLKIVHEHDPSISTTKLIKAKK